MGHSSHRPPLFAAFSALVLLSVACIGDGSNEAATEADEGLETAGRCDIGFNTATYNDTAELAEHLHDDGAMGEVDFTLREWAEVFVDAELGMTIDEVVDVVGADDIYRRHVLGGVLTHTLDPSPWSPMTDGNECGALAAELGEARAAAVRYPTVADALADGYILGDSYYAGLGVHYQNWDYLDAFAPGRPLQLLFDGTDDDSSLVGLSFVVSEPDGPPEGFTGDNDHWHRHRSFCLDVDSGINLSSDVLSEAECVALGGAHVPNTELWMLHAWVASGCESDWGMFSGANPRLLYLPEGTSFEPGCNSGHAVDDPLDLDDRGRGLGL